LRPGAARRNNRTNREDVHSPLPEQADSSLDSAFAVTGRMHSLPVAPPPEIDEVVTSIVGVGAKLIRAVELSRPNVTSARRRYFTHTMEIDGRELDFFSKTSPAPSENLLATEKFLASCKFSSFRTPTFFGMAEWSGGAISTWEAVKGTIYPMEDAPLSIVNRLVRIAADIAGATDQAKEAMPSLYRRNTVFEQLSDMLLFTLKQLAAAGVEVDDIMDDAKLYEKNEHRAFLRFDYLGNVLSHFDFGNSNVIYPPDRGMPVVIDWDAMGMAPPGGALRKLAEIDKVNKLSAAALYARLLTKQGRKVEAHDVYFTMCVAQGLSFLSWACRRRDRRQGVKIARTIRRGFKLFRMAQESPWVPQILPEELEA